MQSLPLIHACPRAHNARSRVGVRAALRILAVSLALLAPYAPAALATNFTTDQNAALQLGSTSFTSTNRGPNMAHGFDRPWGVQLDPNGRVLVGDFGNNRLAVFNSLPSSNGANIDLVVRNLGKTDYRGGCASTQGRHVAGGWSTGSRLAVVEAVESSAVGSNSRVLLYNSFPTTDGAAPNVVLGQTSLTTCGAGATSASTLDRPVAVWTNGTRIIVADRDNNRVLIWNSWPTSHGAPANIVLGQATMTSSAGDGGVESASTLERPSGVWSDGTRIVVADTFNNRVLVWNSWPTTNGQAADLVVGQPDFATTTTSCSASKLHGPYGIASDGTRLAIGDLKSRVLLYDSFPAMSGAAANRVLGQPNTTTCNGRNAGATTALTASSIADPFGVATDGTRLLVSDRQNHRVLAWTSWPTTDNQPADRVLGHTSFTAAGPNDIGLHNIFHWSFYSGVTPGLSANPLEPNNGGSWPAITPSGELLIVDSAGSRLDRFGGWPTAHDQAPIMRFGQHADDQAFCNGTDEVVRAESLCFPMGVWTDGTRLVVSDTTNHRVKIWNTYPTSRNQPPDLVLGQPSWTSRSPGSGASGLTGPTGVASNGTYLAVADTSNERVLVWTSWPSVNGQAADLVLGQPDFATTTANTGGRSAQSLDGPIGLSISDGKLAVADQDNNRILIWNSLPTSQRQAADVVYGQTDFVSAATTSLELPRGIALSDNALFFTARCDAQYLDPIPTATTASGASRIGKGCSSSSPSQPNNWVPTGIAVRNGSVWLANDGNARMSRWDDVTAPTIVKGPAHSVRSGCGASAVVSWTTSESGTTELHWGTAPSATTAGYANHAVDSSITGLLHQRTLSGLASGTYYYRVRTADAAGNEVASAERSFTVDGAAPANDLFANATSVGSSGGTFSGTTIEACSQAGEPLHASVPGGSSVWYVWTAPSNGRFVIDTIGSDFDTTLAVYTGTSVDALAEVVSNDDAGGGTTQSRAGFNAVSGTTYRIAIDGWYGDSGSLTLTLQLVANDAFGSASELTGTIDTAVGSTVGATKEAGEPNHADNAGGASIWYVWTAPTTGTVVVDTLGSSYDTLLAAYTGSSVDALTLVASNDDAFGSGGPSQVTFTATMGTTYRFAVDGWNGASGDVTVHLVQAPTLTAASPSAGPQGRRSLVVQLTGTAFTSTSTVAFSGTGITVTGTSYVSPTRIDVTVDIASSAALGARDVTVSNPNSTTATGLFTVTTPSITLELSTLGYADGARTDVAPYALGFGLMTPGEAREIGPTGSGQTVAGPAVRVSVSSDTHTQLSVAASDWTGTGSFAAAQLSWKRYSVTEAWSSMTTSGAVTNGLVPPGTSAIEHDLRLQVPALQLAGSYSATMTYTLVVAP